jgi:hypothetical protein
MKRSMSRQAAAEKNSRVLVVPVPVELLRFLGRAASAAGRARGSARQAQPPPGVPANTGYHENAERQPPRSGVP